MVINLEPKTLTCLSLDHRDNRRFIFTVLSEDGIILPVTEFFACINAIRAFFDAVAQFALILTRMVLLGITAYLFGQVNVLYLHQPCVNVVV